MESQFKVQEDGDVALPGFSCIPEYSWRLRGEEGAVTATILNKHRYVVVAHGPARYWTEALPCSVLGQAAECSISEVESVLIDVPKLFREYLSAGEMAEWLTDMYKDFFLAEELEVAN